MKKPCAVGTFLTGLRQRMQSLGVIAVFGIGRNVSDPVFGCSHAAIPKSWDILDFYMLKPYNDSIEMLSEIIG